MLFQPGIQRCQIREAWHLLPQPRSGILNVLLDLPLLTACGRIAELGLEDVVVRHCEKADVDLPLLAAAHAITRRLHFIVDATARHAAELTKAVPVGIEQHLKCLQQVRPDQKSPTVRELNVGNLKLRALAAYDGIVFTPIELECFAWAEIYADHVARCVFRVEFRAG